MALGLGVVGVVLLLLLVGVEAAGVLLLTAELFVSLLSPEIEND